MSPETRQSSASARSRALQALSCVVLLLAVAVFLYSVALVDRDPESGFFYDLPPSDAIQYYASAANFARSGSFFIWVDGALHPSLYPFGYSLLIAATFPFLPEPVAGPFVVNVLASALILAIMFFTTYRLHGLLPASVVALVTATIPSFILLGNSPMSATPGALVLIASVCAWLLYAQTGRARFGIAASLLLGVGLWFRTSYVFFLALLGTSVFLRREPRLRERFGTLVLHGTVAGLAALPILAYNWWQFGGPHKTGYHYWTGPGVFANLGAKRRFSIDYLPDRLADLGREVVDLPMTFSTANLFGTGSHIGLAFTVLVVLAMFVAMRKRPWACIGLGAAPYLFAVLCYYRYFGRLLLPIFLIVALSVGALVAAVVQEAPGRRRRVLAGVVGILVVGSAVGYTRQGVRTELAALFDVRHFERNKATAFLLVRGLEAARGEEPCLVVTDVPTPYVRALAGPDVVPLSLEIEKDFKYFRPYQRDDEARHRAMAEWASEDRCVMVALAGRFDELDEKLAPLAGYEWREVYSRPHKGNRVFGAARLVRSASGGVPSSAPDTPR